MKMLGRAACAAIAIVLLSGGLAAAGEKVNRKAAIRTTDAATGAEIRAYRGDGTVAIEIDHPSVQIRKEVTGSTSKTMVRSGGEEIALTFEPNGVVVSGTRGRLQITPSNRGRMAQARAWLAASPAIARAAALIGRFTFTIESPLQQSLLVTRAVLLSVSGDKTGAEDLARAMRQLQARHSAARLVRASTQDGPTACWMAYAAEAIATYIEYEQCMADEQWWDLLGQASCGIIYEMRAIGAFAWWLSCVGLKG